MKKFKKLPIFLVIALIGFTTAKSQNLALVQSAFETSYAYESNGLYSKSIETIKNVYDAKSYEMNLRLGWLSYKNGNLTESATYYKTAIEILPTSIEARLGYVLPESVLGNWDNVITQYLEILKFDPKNSTVNYRMGLIYYNKADFENSYKYLGIASALYPFDYDINLNYGWACLKLSKFDEAKTTLNRVLLISPKDAFALDGLKQIK
jgi:tetratricopeptide (TPR) repeat protein